MNAIWAVDYDMFTDKIYKCPSCPECNAPVVRFKDGKYKCLSCRQEMELPDPNMLKWLTDREGEKVEMHDCLRSEVNGHVHGCGGTACVETHYVRNKATMKWQPAWGECKQCGMRFIV